MSKAKKRILALALTIVVIATGLIVANVFAQEPIPMPSAKELSYGRTMYAIYKMYQNGEITQEEFESCVNDDVADFMGYTLLDSHIKTRTATPSKKGGMEGLNYTQTDSGAAKMHWWFKPDASVNYWVSANELTNNFYFLFGANVTSCSYNSEVRSITTYEVFCKPRTTGYYYGLVKYWDNYYGSDFSWKVWIDGPITWTDFSAHLLDYSNPGRSGWKAEITETGDLEHTVYQLKLVPKNDDRLRVANTQITVNDLENLQLSVQMYSRAYGETYTIPAKAVNLDTTGIYFEFYGDKWASIWQEELQITAITAETKTGSYWIYDPYSKKSITDLVGLKSEYPITDFAGNQIVLDGNTSISCENLILDRNSPSITGMDFRPSSVPSNHSAEADMADAYLGGSYFYTGNMEKPYYPNQIYWPSLRFDESIFVEEQDRDKVYAVLNIYNKDGTPVVTPLRMVWRSELEFESVEIKPGMYTKAGESVKIVSLVGGDYVHDTVGNFRVQNPENIHENFTAPYIVYVDGYAPTVTVDTAVIQWKDSDGTYYTDREKIQNRVTAIALTVPIMVEDVKNITIDGERIDISSGGAGTTTGYLALYNTYASKNISYRYTVTQSTQFPSDADTTVIWSSGTISGYGRTNYAAFGVGKEGSYVYLHLELSNLDDVEFSDVNGMCLALKVQDISENDAYYQRAFTGIHVDNVAPTVSVRKNNVYPQSGSATLSAFVSADDINRVESLWCAWSDVETDDPVYTQFTENWVECAVSGTDSVTKHLYIKAVDNYGNYTVKHETFTVNLTTAASQYVVTGDWSLPTADPGLTISAPLTSTGAAVDTPAGTPVTRVTLAWQKAVEGRVGYELYFRYFDSTAENVDPFAYGEGITWYYLRYEVSSPPENLNYTDAGAVAVEGTPAWASYYGDMEVYIASCIGGFEPLGYQKGDIATYSYEHIGTVAHAPYTENLYSIEYTTYAYDNQGNQVEIGSKRNDDNSIKYCYYRMDQEMTGVQFTLNLTNTANPAWGYQDIDFSKSYAVLVAVNPDGTIRTDANGAYEEVSSRLMLDTSLKQVLSVPSATKDGSAFATGGYTWVICIAQKGGAVQTFADCFWYLLLDDAAVATDNFGVRSQTNHIEVTYGNQYGGQTIETVQKNEDGSVLGSVNIGVATVSEMHYEGIKENVLHHIDGFAAYSTGILNGTIGQHNYRPQAGFTITASIGEGAQYGTWLDDQTLGAIAGIRFWNQASTGEGSARYVKAGESYSSGGVEGKFTFDTTTGVAQLVVTFPCGTREGQATSIMDPESLAQRNPGAFAVTMGSNTICYQLVMENGKESPVYQFELNLVDEAPQVAVEFEYGPNRVFPEPFVDDSSSQWVGWFEDVKIAEYIDVHFTDVVSRYTGLQVYFLSYDGDAESYNIHQLTQDELTNGYRITEGSHSREYPAHNAENGYSGTRIHSGYPYGTYAFFLVTDDSGNAMAVYPMNDTAYNHRMQNLSISSRVYVDDNGNGVISLPGTAQSMGQYVDKVEFTLNGSELAGFECTFGYELEDIGDYIPSLVYTGTTDAGLGMGAVAYDPEGYLYLAWPYDPAVEEGTMVEHTIEITYTVGEHKKTETFQVSAPNTKPALVSATSYIGFVELTYNVPVKTMYNGNSTSDYIILSDPNLYGQEYVVEFVDLYGNSYSQVITIDQMPGLKISYSTTEPTTNPVTATVTYTSELFLEGSTTGATTLELTFTENGSQNLYDAQGNLVGRVYVNNIYDTLEVDPYIYWDYRQNDLQDGNTIYGEVTAYLVDRNGAIILDPATGKQAKFTFYPGGETSYTFSGCYTDRGTAVENITARLDVKLAVEPVETDTYAPDVDILSYVTFENRAYDAESIYRLDSGRFDLTAEGGEKISTLMDYTAIYGDDCYFGSVTELVSSLGWARSYMFHFDIRDESKVKIIIRTDLYEDNITYNTKPQTIDGVNLVGRTLEISKNVEFALYLVDEYNNVTPIYFQVTALGGTPVPNTEQVLTRDENGNYVVRIYLMPLMLTNVSDQILTNENAKIDQGDYTSTDVNLEGAEELTSRYKGLYYVVVEENGEYPIHYTYTYRGVAHKGSVQVQVDMIDNTVAAVTESSWSHNYYEVPTNQDVTWQAQLSAAVRSVSAVYMQDGQYMALSNMTMQEHGVYISYMDRKITVIFERSTAALEETYGTIYLKLTAAHNNMVSYHALPSVTTIDKASPVLTAVVSYSPDHKSATITITSNETAISQNANQKGTAFTFTVRENTSKTYTFVDAAGNRSSIDVTVDGLVLTPLTITLMDEQGNVITNPARYEAQIGQKIRVLTNRPATVWIYGDEVNAQAYDGVTPVELTVSENNMGLHPTIGAEDAYGNTAMVQLEYIMPKNIVAPVITVHRLTVAVSCNATEEQILQKLRENIIYSDDDTPTADLVVTVDYDRYSTSSQRLVTYTVTDQTGNISMAQCWLRIRSGLEPEITVNGTTVQSDDILYLGMVQNVTLTVSFDGNLGEPYKLVYEAGNLQSWAKLKDAIYLTDGYTDAANATFTLNDLENGWYSFALFTQSMEVYYFQIYVGAVS